MPNQSQLSIVDVIPIAVFLVVLIFLFWWVVIRPANKRARDHVELVRSLMPGDQVVTAGGIHGTIREVRERTVTIEVARDTVLTFDKYAVRRREKPKS